MFKVIPDANSFLRKNELVRSDWGSIVGSLGLHIYYFQAVPGNEVIGIYSGLRSRCNRGGGRGTKKKNEKSPLTYTVITQGCEAY